MSTLVSRRSRGMHSLAALLATAVLGACADPAPLVPDPHLTGSAARVSFAAAGSAELNRALAELRRATARYHDLGAASADGFTPLGCEGPGAGIVYVNFDRVDATIDPSHPEALLYHVDEHGKLKLAGVELAVPAAAWTSENPPELYGVPFEPEDGGEIWALHVWVWRHNPDGMFAETNPHVSCGP